MCFFSSAHPRSIATSHASQWYTSHVPIPHPSPFRSRWGNDDKIVQRLLYCVMCKFFCNFALWYIIQLHLNLESSTDSSLFVFCHFPHFRTSLQLFEAVHHWVPGFEQIFRQIIASPKLVEPHSDLTRALTGSQKGGFLEKKRITKGLPPPLVMFVWVFYSINPINQVETVRNKYGTTTTSSKHHQIISQFGCCTVTWRQSMKLHTIDELRLPGYISNVLEGKSDSHGLYNTIRIILYTTMPVHIISL